MLGNKTVEDTIVDFTTTFHDIFATVYEFFF